MKEIIVYQFEKEIEAPIELVFDCVCKDEHIQNWNSVFVENIYEDGADPLKAGTKFINKAQLGKKIVEIKCEVIEANAPYSATIQSTTKEGISSTTYAFIKTEVGTKMTVEVRNQSKNIFYRIAHKSMKFFIKAFHDEEFENCVSYISKP